MKAALLVESLTGNTWKAADLIADKLQQERWTITGMSKVGRPDLSSIQRADSSNLPAAASAVHRHQHCRHVHHRGHRGGPQEPRVGGPGRWHWLFLQAGWLR